MNLGYFKTAQIAKIIIILLLLLVIVYWINNQRLMASRKSLEKGLARLIDKTSKLLTVTKAAQTTTPYRSSTTGAHTRSSKTTVVSHPTTRPKEAATKLVIPSSTTNRLPSTAPKSTTPAAVKFKERVKKTKAFQVFLKPVEREMMLDLLQFFDRVMREHNITYMMYGGTLLGSFRHHGLVPWDDDVDVFLPHRVKRDLPALFRPYRPRYRYTDAGHGKLYREDGWKSSSYGWRWPYIDMSFYKENATHLTDTIWTYGRTYAYLTNTTFPLHYRPFGAMRLPAPHDTFAFLVQSYGEGSQCQMFGYSHVVEGGGAQGTVDCTSLRRKFPFVDHLPVKGGGGGVREVLKLGNKVLHEEVLPEPAYAVSEMFSLKLKAGFTRPPP